jgi:hypothetical protein
MRELNTLDDLVEEFYIATGSRAENHSLVTLLKSLRVRPATSYLF